MRKTVRFRTALLILAIAAIPLVAWAYATKPVGTGVNLVQSASAPGPSGTDRLWIKSSTGHLVHTGTSNVDGDVDVGGANYYATIDNAGTPLAGRTILNFTGAGVSCVDNAGATRTDCTITGGASGNWTFSGNNADLTGAGTMGIGLATATAISLGVGNTNNPVVTLKSNTAQVIADFNVGAQLVYGSSSAKVTSAEVVLAPTSDIRPGANQLVSNGQFNFQYTNIASQLYYGNVGGNIASAATIAPVNHITHITGTTTITTITVPNPTGSGGSWTGCLVLIPDGLWVTGTSGNIALATTAVVSRAVTECFDGTKWYPSY
jgi:hypothetical protein